MRFSTHKFRQAFTLIEVMIVIVIIAILTIALALNYPRAELKVRYDTHLYNIKSIFQEARSRSLSTILLNGTEAVAYYSVEFSEQSIDLKAYSKASNETLESYKFDDDISADLEFEVYYFPPNGELCLGSPSCNDARTEVSTTLSDSSGTYSTTFTVTAAGGQLEVE